MDSNTLRSKFLSYFQTRGHTKVPSSSLIPGQDPSLLFTNAGMVQFKNIFLGEPSSYHRAVSIQRCVRAGGKHNDLENVGYTARHHTFFEMMGNFSFGDYFKRDAIQFAWQFLTEELAIPKERLWITVYETDEEAEAIWLNEMGVPAERLSRCGANDNFWSMGDTGPCGPCTEIFYDHGPEISGGPPGSPDADGDRYIEIWNLVFMQYNRDETGQLHPLPKPSVDTGMGLERIAAVLQGVHDNYDIDSFRSLIQAIDQLLQRVGVTASSSDAQISKKVIADHIRSAGFLIHDGIIPGNEGRGYVLRRIIRRALRHGHKIGMPEEFFHHMVQPWVAVMSEAYPEIRATQSAIEKVIALEEQQFLRTMQQGLKIFEQNVAQLKSQILPGELIFKLYDTYGFPVDLTADIARERDFELDYTGFQVCMENQRSQSQAASQFSDVATSQVKIDHLSEFAGYERLEDEVNVMALFRDGQPVEVLRAGDLGWVILNRTPFYAESGGQVGDQGQLIAATGVFDVTDTRSQDQAHLHIGTVVQGELKVSQVVMAAVNGTKRHATALNHTATHLLHAAMRKIIGEHVVQRGSLVAPDRLRFDFSHYQGLSVDELHQIERLVNQQIRRSIPVHTDIMTPEAARAEGAMALFGEKYSEQVRVLSMGDFSKELCGGTHVHHTGEIGLFKITSEAGIAAGIRRIEAVTGENALDYLDQLHASLMNSAQSLNCALLDVPDKLTQLQHKIKAQEKQLEQWTAKYLSSLAEELEAKAQAVAGHRLVVARVDELDSKQLRQLAEAIRNRHASMIVVLASVVADRLTMVIAVASPKAPVTANHIAQYLAEQVQGKGGGKPDFAQVGGPVPKQLNTIWHSLEEWLQTQG